MLTPIKMLRLALAIELLLIFTHLALPAIAELKLPPTLQTYLDRGEQRGWTPKSPVTRFITIPFVPVHLCSAAGLWFRRRWARLPYAISSVWAIFGALFGGPPVQHVLQYVSEQSWIFVCGGITALVYYAAIEWATTKKA